MHTHTREMNVPMSTAPRVLSRAGAAAVVLVEGAAMKNEDAAEIR